jgi:hypothetical protein
MSDAPATPTTRRIAVALDAGERNLRIIALTAGIAAALRAELEGVFIEDAALLHAVGLPFQREFRLTTRGEAHTDVARTERELRAAARQVRASLAESAQRLGCRWSFRAWRGDLEAEILSAASSADMFALSPLGRFAPIGRWPRPTQGTASAQDLVIGVLWDGSAGAFRALAAGAELAAGGHARLQIFLQAADAAGLGRLRQQVADTLRETKDGPELIALVGEDPQAVISALLEGGGDILMVDADNPLLGRRTLWKSLAALRCPLLIVR